MSEIELSREFVDACFRWPKIREETIQRVSEMLRCGRTSWDLECFESFERDVAALFGVRHALSFCNGTSASYCAMRALDVAPGDTVIASSISHWAALLPAVQCGARIILADAAPGSFYPDPKAIGELIAPSTKALVITHLFGIPARVDEYRIVCDEHQIALIEDVSHAHGATYLGRPVGGFGDLSFCSFQAQKLVSGGEGGALLTNRADLYYRAMELGHPRRLFAAPGESRKLAGVGRGFKFRLSPIHVAIAHDSLRHLQEENQVRLKACNRFRDRLDALRLFEGIDRSEGRVFFCCELLLAEGFSEAYRDRLVDRLRSKGAPVDKLYAFLPDHPSLRGHLAVVQQWPQARSIANRIMLWNAFTMYSEPAIEQCVKLIEDSVASLKDSHVRAR